MNLTSDRQGFSGPVGTGKSYALCYKALQAAFLNPGCQGLIGAPTFPMLYDVTLPAFLQILDQEELDYSFQKSRRIITLKATGSEILFRSLKEYNRLRGLNLAWFGVDELTYCTKDPWEILEQRLRAARGKKYMGFAVWTPKGFDWVYQRFISPTKKLDGYQAILATPGENKAVLRRDARFYDRMKEGYDPRFYEQEALGKYLNVFSGRVYQEYDQTIHDDANVAYTPLAPLAWCLDFNVDPYGTVIAQHLRGEVTVLDEIMLRGGTTTQMCEAFLDRIQPYVEEWQRTAGSSRPFPIALYGDPAGNSRSTRVSESDYDLIRIFFRGRPQYKLDWHIGNVHPAVKDRVAAVNARLKSADGKVHMRIHPRCKELRADFEETSWIQGATSIAIDKDKDDKRTHWSDALGYMVVKECKVDGFERRLIYS